MLRRDIWKEKSFGISHAPTSIIPSQHELKWLKCRVDDAWNTLEANYTVIQFSPIFHIHGHSLRVLVVDPSVFPLCQYYLVPLYQLPVKPTNVSIQLRAVAPRVYQSTVSIELDTLQLCRNTNTLAPLPDLWVEAGSGAAEKLLGGSVLRYPGRGRGDSPGMALTRQNMEGWQSMMQCMQVKACGARIC